jgi:hypothetical protein
MTTDSPIASSDGGILHVQETISTLSLLPRNQAEVFAIGSDSIFDSGSAHLGDNTSSHNTFGTSPGQPSSCIPPAPPSVPRTLLESNSNPSCQEYHESLGHSHPINKPSRRTSSTTSTQQQQQPRILLLSVLATYVEVLLTASPTAGIRFIPLVAAFTKIFRTCCPLVLLVPSTSPTFLFISSVGPSRTNTNQPSRLLLGPLYWMRSYHSHD